MKKHLVNESLELALAHTQIQNTRDAQNVINAKLADSLYPYFLVLCPARCRCFYPGTCSNSHLLRFDVNEINHTWATRNNCSISR